MFRLRRAKEKGRERTPQTKLTTSPPRTPTKKGTPSPPQSKTPMCKGGAGGPSQLKSGGDEEMGGRGGDFRGFARTG